METVLAGWTAAMLRYAASRGVDVAAIIAREKVSARELEDPDGRLELGRSTRIWEAVLSAVADPDFGLHFSQHPRTASDFGAVAYVMRAASNLRDACEALARFHQLCGMSSAHLEATERGAALVFRVHPGRQRVERHVAEAIAGNIMNVARRATRHPIAPLHVSFAHQRPRSVSELQRVLGCRWLSFGRSAARIEFARESLLLPFHSSDVSIKRYLEQQTATRARQLSGEVDLVAQVEKLIAEALVMPPTVEAVGRALGMSTRTLQRRLSDEGHSYLTLVDGVRARLAVALIADPQLRVSEVAHRLGFSDLPSFRKAFKRWTRGTPRAFRANLGA